jgi:hypothetical protein
VNPQARQQTLRVFCDILGDLYPGLRWEPIEGDRPESVAAPTARRKIVGSEPEPTHPHPIRRELAATGDDHGFDRSRQQTVPRRDVQVRPKAA